MASQTVTSIDWPLSPTLHTAVPPEHHLHGANGGYKSQDLQQPAGRERATLRIPGHRTACTATQGSTFNPLPAAEIIDTFGMKTQNKVNRVL